MPTCIVGLLLISTLQSFAALGVSKQSIRERIWDYMESHDIADFPRPVHHRIPNFKVVFLGLLEGDQAIRFRGTAPPALWWDGFGEGTVCGGCVQRAWRARGVWMRLTPSLLEPQSLHFGGSQCFSRSWPPSAT